MSCIYILRQGDTKVVAHLYMSHHLENDFERDVGVRLLAARVILHIPGDRDSEQIPLSGVDEILNVASTGSVADVQLQTVIGPGGELAREESKDDNTGTSRLIRKRNTKYIKLEFSEFRIKQPD